MKTNMPNRWLHFALMFFGFFMGFIWGCLAIDPYKRMRDAILRGDVFEAWENAKLIEKYVFIGVVFNIFIIILFR